MKERPIIFSGPMVRAIIDGRKSQTRRILKPQPESQGIKSFGEAWAWKWPGCGFSGVTADQIRAFGVASKMVPYAVGDRLYVRETWSSPYCYAEFRPRDCGGPFWYWADGNPTDGDWSRPRPSIHMPKWATRIWLTVTEVRVQRLQDISEEDARAEGVRGNESGQWGCEGLIEDFAELWESIHGAGAWEDDPWVAAITFKVSG